MPKYTVYLMTPYCSWDVDAKNKAEARKKVDYPLEFDMSDEHCLIVIREDQDFYEVVR